MMDIVATDRRSDTELQGLISGARRRGVAWLVDRIADNGRPDGADVGNFWWRAPWALAVGGAPDAAAAMLGWVEREALTDNGALRDGVYGSGSAMSPVYHAGPIAIGAWLLARYDTATAVMASLDRWVNPATGGVYHAVNHDQDPVEELLKTAQLGIAALVTGRRDVADGVYVWLRWIFAAQPDLPHVLYVARRGDELLTSPPAGPASFAVDFRLPQQAYFHPGIAAAFLAGYAGQAGNKDALTLARAFLAISEQGTEAQYDDPTSVQVCKVGWGHAALYAASPDAVRRRWVQRLGQWFVDRQEPDGSWAPASFNTPRPGLLDYYWKTAEHVMELSYIEQALRGGQS